MKSSRRLIERIHRKDLQPNNTVKFRSQLQRFRISTISVRHQQTLSVIVIAVLIFSSILNVTMLRREISKAYQQQQTRLKSVYVDEEDYASACMLIMDDNHWLVEWLAYHWTTMNLRYLIIAIDGRSRTSPISILDRWKGRIAFELWNDEHFFPDISDRNMNLQEINEYRQRVFLGACARTLKRNHPRTTWVIFTDTDEFISVNRLVSQKHINGRANPLFRSRGSPLLGKKNGLLHWFERERINNNTTCFSMTRKQYSPHESSSEIIERATPHYLNASAFLTLRWLRTGGDLPGPKNIIHLPSVPWNLMPTDEAHQHQVIPDLCENRSIIKPSAKSLLQVHHYFGTLEQFTFRDDARFTANSGKKYGRNSRFDRFMKKSSEIEDDLRPWLSAFVESVGDFEAARLLEGIGRIHGWPNATAHYERFASLLVPTNEDEMRMKEERGPDAMVIVKASDQKAGNNNASRDYSLVYSMARFDRSGAVVGDMLLASAYAFSENLTYGGACVYNRSIYIDQARQLIASVGLSEYLMFTCPTDVKAFINRRKYTSLNSGIFSDRYLKFVRSQVKYPKERHGGAVVHVRRGDVSPCGFYANRYLPNSYYLDVIAELIPSETIVTILSESEAFESLKDFANHIFMIDSDLVDSWQAILTADFIVLSKSSFSFIPAMLNPTATVFYAPFSKSKLPGWVTVPTRIQVRSRERLLKIINTNCSYEDAKLALRKIA